MAINRAPWNALVDDDGSNLVGSVWNKAAIKDVVLDPVDAAIVAATPQTSWTVVEWPTGGTLHNFNPGIVGNTIITLKATCTISGFKPAITPYNGQRITITTVGAGLLSMSFLHENAGSAAGSKLHTQAATQTFTGYWAMAQFQYLADPTIAFGEGYWLCLGGANGHQVLE